MKDVLINLLGPQECFEPLTAFEVQHPYFLSMTSVLTWITAGTLALFLLILHLRWEAWPHQHAERPAAIAIRAEGISGGLQPAHTAHTKGFFKWWKHQVFLSFCFLLSASPPCSSIHAKPQWLWLFLCCCIAFLCTAPLPHGYVLLPITVLPDHGFCFCGSGCLLVLQKAGGNVTGGVGIFSANLRIRTGFSGSIGLVFPYLSLLHCESAGTENPFFRSCKFPTAVKALW